MRTKKLCRRFVASLLLLAASTMSWAYDFEVDGIYYNKNSDGTSVAVASGDIRYSGEVVIPSTVSYEEKEYSVTSIGNGAFWGCSGLTSITIPESVTSIGSYAFSRCSGLTSITIPESVTSIGYDAFSGCTNLPVIDNIRYADTYLVEAVDKTQSTYSIKEGTRFIGSSAFYYCFELTSITIPSSVTSIYGNIFPGCSGLASIVVDANNPNYDSRENCNAIIETSSNRLITGCMNTVIPESVTRIGSYAFSDCSGLASISIPNSVTTIESYAFSDCSGLASIVVDANNPNYDSRENCNAIIETSSNSLIAGCKNTVIPNSVTSIGEGAFYYCSGLTSIIIPESVTSIGSNAFWGCSGLTSINIPESVTSIGYGAFWDCSGLTSITIPNSVTTIESSAFSYCSGLTSVTLPNSVTSIGEDAFYYCSGLTSINIPESVTSFGSNAFWGCSGLVFVTCLAKNVPAISSYVFSDYSTTLYVPSSAVNEYKTADVWKDFANILSLEDKEAGIWAKGVCGENVNYVLTKDSVLTISGAGSMTNYYSINTVPWRKHSQLGLIKSVEIKEGVTSIGFYAFQDCSALTSVTIPSSMTAIYGNAFRGCSGLTSIVVDANNPNYDSRESCNAIIETSSNRLITGCKNTVIPESVTEIYDNAFYHCSGLTSITIPESVTSIGSYAFRGCSGLTSIVVDANNKRYDSRNGSNAIIETSSNTLIAGCKNTVIPNSVTSIGSYAFLGCSGLTSITIPESVTSIGYGAFSGCTNLPVIDNIRYADTYLVEAVDYTPSTYSIKEGTRFIGSSAFFYCSGLTSITIPESVTTIGDYAFDYCSALTSINIPESVTSIGNYAFNGCTSLPVENNLRYADTYLVEAVDKTLSNYSIRRGTRFIGSNAFEECAAMTSIDIPEGVREVKTNAFSGCTALASVTLPASTRDISSYVFYGCANLKKVSCLVKETETPPSHYNIEEPEKPLPGVDPSTLTDADYLYPFNPAHPDDPTTDNYEETVEVTAQNVYPEEECKQLWLDYYKKVFNNRTAMTRQRVKWINLSSNPYIRRTDSEVVLLSTYLGEWTEYQDKLEVYEVYKQYATVPVPATDVYAFGNTPLSDATLYVYEDVIDAYKVTTPWSGFGQILPIDPQAVEELKAASPKADADAPIYDLMGRRLAEKPASGIYIQNGKKYLVK